MNLPFAIAGALSLLAAAIHGGAGEALVVRKSQFGSDGEGHWEGVRDWG